MNEFSKYHPVVNLIYFTAVIVFTMFIMHPVCLAISLVCSCAYSVVINGKKSLRFNLIYIIPMLIIAALLNPLFNHEGITIITYFPSGNPLTLESIIYGISAAVVIASVILWFSCYNAVMTSDKFIYLFGRIIPSLSLILSMAFRFIPKFINQIKTVSNAQKCIGRDISQGSILQRLKNGITIISIIITWSLENAIQTADSMKSRGYGLAGRTAFSVFRFDLRDAKALFVILSLAIYILTGCTTGGTHYRYFPSMGGTDFSPYTMSVFFAYLLLCTIPIIIEIWEEKKWKSLKSKI